MMCLSLGDYDHTYVSPPRHPRPFPLELPSPRVSTSFAPPSSIGRIPSLTSMLAGVPLGADVEHDDDDAELQTVRYSAAEKGKGRARED